MLKYGMLCGSITLVLLTSTARTGPRSPPKCQPTPLLTLRAGRTFIWAVKYSHDSTRLATFSANEYAALWDATTGRRLLIVDGDSAPLTTGIAFHPKGDHLVTGGRRGTLAFWDARTGRKKVFFRDDHLPVLDLAFHPGGQSLAVGGFARGAHTGLEVWDNTTAGRKAGFLVRGRTVSLVVFSPDGKRLASADTKGQVVVWEVATGQAAFTCSPEGRLVAGLAWSPNSQQLATSSVGGTVTVWKMASGKAAMRLRGRRLKVGAVAFLPDGKRLLASEYKLPLAGRAQSPQGQVRVWDTTTGEGKIILRSQAKEGGICALCLSPDGRRVAVGFEDGTVKVWSVKDLLRR